MPDLIRYPPFLSVRHVTTLHAMVRDPAVCMMASGFNGALYTGVTSNLLQRVYQHRTSALGGFSAEYGVKRLVRFEMHGTMEGAIAPGRSN